MFAKLTALVSNQPSFPYNIGKLHTHAWGSGWSHYEGTAKEDGSVVSIFKMSSTSPSDRALLAARNGVKRLKTVRGGLSLRESYRMHPLYVIPVSLLVGF
jgi:SCY1-like protein 1